MNELELVMNELELDSGSLELSTGSLELGSFTPLRATIDDTFLYRPTHITFYATNKYFWSMNCQTFGTFDRTPLE
jgi:hypothetical protein